jgi:hypothetical protein
LLGGAIKATEIKAVSQTSLNGGTFSVDATGSSFSSLTVAGVPIAADVAPNTTIPLLGLGKVVLFEQIPNKSSTALTVNMIHVYVTESNLLGLSVGTQIIIASASSGLSRVNAPGVLSGESFGTKVTVSVVGPISSGPSAVQYLACLGTNGEVESNSVASVSVPTVLGTGAVVDSAQGTVGKTETSGDTSSTISSINLLGGLISAETLTAEANASSTNGTEVAVNDDGTVFREPVGNRPSRDY